MDITRLRGPASFLEAEAEAKVWQEEYKTNKDNEEEKEEEEKKEEENIVIELQVPETKIEVKIEEKEEKNDIISGLI